LALYTDLANEGAKPLDWGERILEMSEFGRVMHATVISAGLASFFSGMLWLIENGLRTPVIGDLTIINGIAHNKDFAHPVAGGMLSKYVDFTEGTVMDKAV